MSGSGLNQFLKWDLKETFQSPIEHGSIPVSLQDGGSGRHSVRISSTDEMLVKMSPGLDKWRRNRSRSRSPRGFNNRNPIFEERLYINNNGIIYHPFETGRMPADGMLRAREAGKGIKGTSFQHGRKTNGIPCKYFALGNCWKGKVCRFSHHTQEYTSSHKLDYADQSRASKLCNTSLVAEATFSGKKHEVSQPRFGTWSNDCEPKHNVEQNKSESKGTDSLLGGIEMSREWKYIVQPPKQASKDESRSIGQISQFQNLNETSLSSLAQPFGNKDQLQQYPTLNFLKSMDNMSQKQCELRLDSMEQMKTENKKGEAGTNEEKKRLDEKRSRVLKFALVEFVKERLDPLWKESQIKKDDYKAIVKKVADKVICTVQGAQIPETKEHIDQYLFVSKLKIMKLIKAYVEKYQQMRKMEACS